MGGMWSRTARKLFRAPQRRVLLLGLDAAGKTTVLNQLTGRSTVTVPTIGFNVETLKWPPFELFVWDVSGQAKSRPLWRHYYRGAAAVVFVIDSADLERLETVREELHCIIKEEELMNCCVLILANKQDLPRSLKAEDVARVLELQRLEGVNYFVQPTIAKQHVGLEDGMRWLVKQLQT
jgi:small GTP-binding protein